MRLRQLRKEVGLSQKEFAKAFGAAQNTVSQWETGARSIDDETLCKLSAFFGVSVDYLLGLSDEKKNPAENLSEAKQEMIELVDKLSDDQVNKLLQIAKTALEL